MTAKEKAENLIKEISLRFPLYYEETIDIALFMVEKILHEQPTYGYWDTYDDEPQSAVTLWNEVKNELETLKK